MMLPCFTSPPTPLCLPQAASTRAATCRRRGRGRARARRCVVAKALSEQDKEYVSKVRQRLMHGETASKAKSTRRAYEPPDATGAMALFRGGRYLAAADAFRAAIDERGERSAQGGRLALWLAQALDAGGEKGEAVAVLEDLQLHPDGEVAATAAELLFIVTAPRLEVPRESFVTMDVADFRSVASKDPRHLAAKGLERRTKREKKIEKYSLEWYATQPRPRNQRNADVQPEMLIFFGVLLCGVLMLAFGSGAAPS